MPRIPEDLRRLMDGARLCWEIMHSDAITPFVDRVIAPRASVMESDNALADYIRRTTSTTWHICGTARMGPRPIRWPSPISADESIRPKTSASPTPQSCPTSSAATPI